MQTFLPKGCFWKISVSNLLLPSSVQSKHNTTKDSPCICINLQFFVNIFIIKCVYFRYAYKVCFSSHVKHDTCVIHYILLLYFDDFLSLSNLMMLLVVITFYPIHYSAAANLLSYMVKCLRKLLNAFMLPKSQSTLLCTSFIKINSCTMVVSFLPP